MGYSSPSDYQNRKTASDKRNSSTSNSLVIYYVDLGTMDFCFELGGMFLGATGAVACGFATGFFKTTPPSFFKNVPDDVKKLAEKYPAAQEEVKKLATKAKYPEAQEEVKKLGAKYPAAQEKVKDMGKILHDARGGPLAWRISKRAALGSLLYCFLECQFQRRYRRSTFDCFMAGAVTGALFGTRAGFPMAAYTAAGFSLYAMASHIVYH